MFLKKEKTVYSRKILPGHNFWFALTFSGLDGNR